MEFLTSSPEAAAALQPVDIRLCRLSLFLERRGFNGEPTLGQRLLCSVSGTIPAASLFLILGASGSGKSSLLNTLALRLPSVGYATRGSVLYGGEKSGALRKASDIAYVQQSDFLLPHLTTHETLLFAARLRLPSSVSGEEKRSRCAALLLELGLRDVAHTRVGDTRTRGISGGEKRRLSVAVQLITNPRLCFLDEPSTGLDAFAARNLCETLLSLSQQGKTVVATLHQPRADILPCFSAALLLSRGGRPLYFGPLEGMEAHFAACGFPTPPLTNPGDHFLDFSAVDFRSSSAEAASLARLDTLAAAWAAAAPQDEATAEAEDASLLLGGGQRVHSGAGRLEQTRVLWWRGMLNTSRDVLTLAGMFAESVVIAVVIGAIFYKLDGTPGGLVSRTSLVYLVGSLQTYQFLIFSIHMLVSELAIYDHETADGMYGVLPWLVARYGELIPQLAVWPTLFSLIVYGMAGLRPTGHGLGVFIGVIFACHMNGFALALFSVACQRTFAQASLQANSVFTFFGLVSGLLVQLSTIPVWLSWIREISFLNFSFRILAVNEFANRSWPCPYPAGSPACDAYSGDATLERLSVPNDTTYPSIAIVVSFLVLAIAGGAVLAVRPLLSARLAAANVAAAGGAASVDGTAPADVKVNAALLESGIDENKEVAESSAVVVVGAPEAMRFRAFAPVTVTLQRVSLWLSPRRSAPQGKRILADIDCSFAPGEFTGIMGASGCGKTTLLNAVACRIRGGEGEVSGSITFNATALSPRAVRAVAGYVQQHDSLLPLLTVTETLQFAARLRLPSDWAPEARQLRVDTVLAELGLKDCAQTHIGLDGGTEAGGAKKRGVSGGEKRRVSIAVQLLTDPALLLLDEPSSGLDAFSSMSIGTTLSRLAREEGRTVIATVHQPREGLFALFNQFMLLAQGRLVYRGAGGTEAPLRYFAALGHSCPEHCNPADFLIDLACVDTRSTAAEKESRARVDALLAAFESSEREVQPAAALLEPPPPAAVASGLSMERPAPSFAVTLPLLVRRSWLNLARQPGALSARVMQALSFGAILSCFYTRLGKDIYSIQGRIGLEYEIMACIFVGMLNCIAVFPMERNVFYREHADGAVDTAAFLASYTILELPCELLASSVFAVMMCPIVGFRTTPETFFVLSYVVFCILNAGESIGIAFCAMIYHVGFSVSMVSIFLSVWSVMSGFFAVGMPAWLQVVNYASVLKYAGNLLAISEFKGLHFTCDTPPCPDGASVLSLYHFHPDEYATHLWAIGLCAIIYRLAAFALLDRLKGRHL